ncbi:MAG: hypothetical protein M1839_008882 [Geoglossum umbratile]|nr:MAG: hypothetical protein M1839_008882 [Geoglossum umbratile]
MLLTLVWGSIPEKGSGPEETVQPPVTEFRVPRLASNSSPPRQTTHATFREPATVSSRIVTVSTRDPIVVSSQSINLSSSSSSSSATPRGNGRATGGSDGVGPRGTRRNSDERDEQMLSLEEFLAETSRMAARRIEIEEEDLSHAESVRWEHMTASSGAPEDLGVIGSGISNTRFRTAPRQWQTPATTSSSSRRQLARAAARLPPPPVMVRPSTETANWSNSARQEGQNRGTTPPVQTPLQLAVAGGPAGFFDVVRRIRHIGTLQDALLEFTPREPDLTPIGGVESRRVRLSEAQRSSRLRAFQSRLDLISSEFELLRANRDELSRLEQDAVNTLRSLSLSTQPESNRETTGPVLPRSASQSPSLLLQMSQIEHAARIRRDLERIDEETRNLRHAILLEHPLPVPTNNLP